MVAGLLDRIGFDEAAGYASCDSGLYYKEGLGKVLVTASDMQDALLIQEILGKCGFTQVGPSSSEAVSERAAFFGAVICHKSGQDEQTKAVLRTLRANRVLILSNCADERTLVSLLDHGGHQFIDINQSHTLLVARIGAALRLHSIASQQPFIVGDIQFDRQRRTVSRAGKAIDLSPKEYELAYYLFANAGRIIGNDELMSAVWLLPVFMDTRRIDTAACRVRKKLELFHSQGWELKRIRRVGYRLVQLTATADSDAPFTREKLSVV